MELKEKIELIKSYSSKEILNGGIHNGTPLLKYVFQIHEEVFGTACKSCSSLLPAYIKKIQNINLNTEIMSTIERKYRMKSGSVIHQRGTSHYYSDLNITDEKAEELLKVNPNRAALFAKIPEGALERLAKEKAAEEKAAQEEKERIAAEEAEAQAQAEEEARKAAEQPVLQLQKVEETGSPEKDIQVKDAEPVKADTPVKEEKAAEEKADADLNMTELREKYPHIKARSREEFLRELNA